MPSFQNTHSSDPMPSNCDRGHATEQKTLPLQSWSQGHRGTKTQISIGGCLALGVPTGSEAAGPSQLPTDSQYQGEENSGRLCSSVYPKAIYWAYTMPNTCSEMLCVISRSHPWQDQEADEGVVKQILRNSKESGCQASMLKEDSGRK